MGMETTDRRFTELADSLCDGCFGGRLPNAPEAIASALLTAVLPKVAEFWRAPDDVAKLALAGFSERLLTALRAHIALETLHWTH